jgi:hypothetical protein
MQSLLWSFLIHFLLDQGIVQLYIRKKKFYKLADIHLLLDQGLIPTNQENNFYAPAGISSSTSC